MRENGETELLDRAAEKLLVELALGRAAGAESGKLLFFEGPAGIGKSSILADAQRTAERRGFTVASARGTELEQDYAWGLVRQLFMPAVSRFNDIAESTPAAALALSLIHGGELPVNEQKDGEYALITSLLWLTDNLASRSPLILTIDDLHWADIPSLRFLANLVVALDGLPVVIAAAVRPGVERIEHFLSAMLDGPDGTVHKPLPLTVEATGTLLAGLLKLELDDWQVDRCHDVTRGNPLLVRELGRQLVENGPPYRIDDLHLANLDRYLRLQLRQLPGNAQEAMLALGVLADHSTPTRIAAVADLPVTDVMDGLWCLQANGLVSGARTPESYALSHPLIGAALHGIMSPADRATYHARAAMAALNSRQLEKAADHLLRVPPGMAGLDAISILTQAARLCMARGSVDNAVAYLRRQLDEDLGIGRLAVLSALGKAEAAVNDESALHHLTAAVGLARKPEQRGQLTLALAVVTWIQQGPDKALALVGSALANERGLSVEAQRGLRALKLDFANMTPTVESIDAELEGLLPWSADSSVGGRLLDAVVGQVQSFHNQREAALEHATRALPGDQLFEDPLAETLLRSAWETLGVCDAPQLAASIESALVHGRRAGSLRLLGVAYCYRAGLMLSRGNLQEAVSDGLAAWEAYRITARDARTVWIGNFLVQSLVACGQYTEAASVLQQIKLHAPPMPRHIAGEGEISLLLAEGKVGEALGVVDAVRGDCLMGSISNPMHCDWRGSLVRCLHLQGNDDEARLIAAENLLLSRQWGTPRAVGRALRAAAIAETGERQLDLLTESVEILAGTEAKYELAQSQYALGDSLRRARHGTEARTHLQAALELAELCGAAPLKGESITALQMVGAWQQTAGKPGPAALTPGEVRVTDLAANGLSNRQIAQSLFVTVKTVEVHLSNAFRKLGIDRRQDLGRALAR